MPLSMSIAQDTITLYQNAKLRLGVALIRYSSNYTNVILCLPLSLPLPQVCIMDTRMLTMQYNPDPIQAIKLGQESNPYT